jgi:predicted N-acetyltransferase YhbS
MDFRTIDVSEREAVLDLLGEWEGETRAHFARYFAHDPTFRDDLCFVAADGDRLVSTLQIFRKRVRLGGAVVEVAGVGNVFTAASHREQGISTRLLEMALAEMPRHGFDLSLLFATRLGFYARLGWQSHPRQWVYVHAGGRALPRTDYEFARFTPADLGAVAALYETSCAPLVGTTVRDTGYWEGQLHTAGNLDEEFLVALGDGEIVAYVRATCLYDLCVLTEHAHRAGHEAATAALVRHLLAEEVPSEPGVATQLAIAPQVIANLEAAGHRCETVDDFFWMWRVIDAASLAAKLGMSEAALAAPDFLHRILPPGRSVYWISDRF